MAFDWLIGNYLSEAEEVIDGDVIEEISSAFDVPTMDAGFNFSTTAIAAVKERLAAKGLDVDHIVILTAMHSKLKRSSTKMSTECKLYVVRTKEGQTNALLFMGCSITEPVVETLKEIE